MAKEALKREPFYDGEAKKNCKSRDSLKDSAYKLFTTLREKSEGMTDTEIYRFFKNHKTKAEIKEIMNLLVDERLVRRKVEKNGRAGPGGRWKDGLSQRRVYFARPPKREFNGDR